MINDKHPDYIRTLHKNWADAESDVAMLIHYARNVLPTLLYVIGDTKDDWRQDMRRELHANLLNAVENAERRHLNRTTEKQDESPAPTT